MHVTYQNCVYCGFMKVEVHCFQSVDGDWFCKFAHWQEWKKTQANLDGIRGTLLKVVLVCLLLLGILVLAKYARAEMSEIVEIADLDDSYVGKKVTVFGYLRHAKVITGRFGGKNFVVRLGQDKDEVMAVARFRIFQDVMFDNVIASGEYIKPCNVSGKAEVYDTCILLDDIRRDW